MLVSFRVSPAMMPQPIMYRTQPYRYAGYATHSGQWAPPFFHVNCLHCLSIACIWISILSHGTDFCVTGLSCCGSNRPIHCPGSSSQVSSIHNVRFSVSGKCTMSQFPAGDWLCQGRLRLAFMIWTGHVVVSFSLFHDAVLRLGVLSFPGICTEELHTTTL